MAVLRGPDGKIIEADSSGGSDEKTRRIQRRSAKVEPESAPEANGEAQTQGRAKAKEENAPAPPVRQAAASGGDEPKTQILRRSTAKDDGDGGSGSGGGKSGSMDDPVVGWVVVIKGPGQGAGLALGYGMNSIGRSSNERICLDFGDEQISRSQHAVITYDPRGRKYFVQHGGGKNLTYLNGDQPVLTPVELKGGEVIALGDTQLRFVPFCGKDFDWQDQQDQ